MNIHQLLSQHITNRMPSGLITVDRDGRITSHNPASERIFEETLDPHGTLTDLVRESAVLENLLRQCLTDGKTFTRVEFHVPNRKNTHKRIGINLSPITNEKSEITGAICLLSDLTEIVELQNRIKLQENLAALGEMSAGIAHEFKNSIATIQGYAQMSIGETDVNALHTYAREIHKESVGLSNLITDFLNFARPVEASIQDIDITELLRSVISDLKTLRPGAYHVRFQASAEAIVPCDATLIRQSFLNLLINAADALDDNGAISVRVDPRQRGDVRVVVEDNGRGIPPGNIEKIFLPFFTTKANGTGLGLSLVQKIILAHNGRIEVESTEQKGARFTVRLPRR